MDKHAFYCLMDMEDNDCPLLMAWALRGTIPYDDSLEQMASAFHVESWLKVIKSVENSDTQNLLRLFIDKAEPVGNVELPEHQLHREMEIIARQYCSFLEELKLPRHREIRHHLQGVILDKPNMCIPSSIVYALHSGIPYYSYDSIMNAIFQSNIKSLEVRHLLFLLASSGIETCLPNLYLGKTYALDIPSSWDWTKESPIEADRNIARIRIRFGQELEEYRTEILEMCSGAYDLIKADDYREAERWAKHKAYTQILPSVRRLEAAISSDSSRLLKRIGVGVLKGIPTIAQECKPGGSPIKATAAELLKIFVGALTVEKKKYPIASYSCLLKKELSNPATK